MSFETSRIAIVNVLKTYTGEPKLFAENNPVPVASQKVEWVRWSIRPAVSIDSDVGGQFQRVTGMVYFQHFTPEGSGPYGASAFATKIEGFLNHKRVSSTAGVLTFERAQQQYIGTTPEGFVQQNITVEWREDGVAVNAA